MVPTVPLGLNISKLKVFDVLPHRNQVRAKDRLARVAARPSAVQNALKEAFTRGDAFD